MAKVAPRKITLLIHQTSYIAESRVEGIIHPVRYEINSLNIRVHSIAEHRD